MPRPGNGGVFKYVNAYANTLRTLEAILPYLRGYKRGKAEELIAEWSDAA